MSESDEKRPLGKSIVMAVLGILSAVYIVNPTAGFIELIPDNIPGIGNLDEAAAVALLISALAYFGFDITKLFGGGKKTGSTEKSVKGTVVDD
jgi:uncharacterized membrane protein YkvA (DUF1232 family)